VQDARNSRYPIDQATWTILVRWVFLDHFRLWTQHSLPYLHIQDSPLRHSCLGMDGEPVITPENCILNLLKHGMRHRVEALYYIARQDCIRFARSCTRLPAMTTAGPDFG